MPDRKPLSPEALEKLKVAREKALEVKRARGKKNKELKALEKKVKDVELDERIKQIKAKVGVAVKEETTEEPMPQADREAHTSDPVTPAAAVKKTKKPASAPKKSSKDVIKQIVEEESSDSSGSESDDDVTEPVKALYKNKYREKYKNKYQAKVVGNLTRGVAAQTIRKKVDDEIFRLASQNLFGNN